MSGSEPITFGYLIFNWLKEKRITCNNCSDWLKPDFLKRKKMAVAVGPSAPTVA